MFDTHTTQWSFRKTGTWNMGTLASQERIGVLYVKAPGGGGLAAPVAFARGKL